MNSGLLQELWGWCIIALVCGALLLCVLAVIKPSDNYMRCGLLCAIAALVATFTAPSLSLVAAIDLRVFKGLAEVTQWASFYSLYLAAKTLNVRMFQRTFYIGLIAVFLASVPLFISLGKFVGLP